MAKIITDLTHETIGDTVNNMPVDYADQRARNEINNHCDRLDSIETGTPFATCATAGSTQAKTVTITGFEPKVNGIVSILFTYGFTTSSPTLNISSKGAKPIMLKGEAIPMGKVRNNTILTMVYDGTNYNVIAIETLTPSTPGAVDLGLPSGLLWADKNVGADTPEAPGHYFSWGNVEAHAEGSGYDFGSSNDGPYASTPGAALTGNIAVGDTYDAARKNMGAPWRLPTSAEFQELYDNCVCEWITQNGMAGRRFTSNKNGNSVFFPAAGHYSGTTLYARGASGLYWASTLYSSTSGRFLSFDSSGVHPQGYDHRFYGFSVRAVQ